MRVIQLAFATLSLLSPVACTGSGPDGGGSGGTAGMSAMGGAANGGSVSHTGGSNQGVGGSTGGIACGTKVCSAGQYCCNPTCSMCAPMGAACIQIACSTTGGTGNAECASDGDCRLFDDYCGGCNCRALPKSAPDPTCSGTIVSCLIAPCMSNVARCVNGLCTTGG